MRSDQEESFVSIIRSSKDVEERNQKIQDLDAYLFHPIKIGDEYGIELTMRADLFKQFGMSDTSWHIALSNELCHISFLNNKGSSPRMQITRLMRTG